VLVVANTFPLLYPNENKLAYAGFQCQFISGVTFVGIYSLMVHSLLVLHLPGWFDETSAHSRMCNEWVARNITVRPWWIRKIGDAITQKPAVYLVPLAFMLCMLPFLYTLTTIKMSYDDFTFFASHTVPEYHNHKLYTEKFNMDRLDPVQLMLQARPVDGPDSVWGAADSNELDSSYPDFGKQMHPDLQAVTLTEEFAHMTCHFVNFMMEETRGKAFEINPSDVNGIWWNPETGCVPPMLAYGSIAGQFTLPSAGECMEQGPCVFRDGMDQTMILFKSNLADSTTEMTRFFFETVQPKANWLFDIQGKKYQFKATLDSSCAEQMLLEGEEEKYVFWISAATLLSVCVIVGYSFGSAFIMVKLVFTVFIPILAEYGMLVGIYQYGWLEWAGVHSIGGIPWPFPFTTMPLLFALAIDYDMFLFARVYELRLEGYENRAAVRIALEETGPPITLAGSLMCVAFYFAFLTSLPVVSMAGAFYLLGVATDTYIVRMWIAPGALCINESMNYWPRVMPPGTKSYEDYDKNIQAAAIMPARFADEAAYETKAY
jgi:hypothetical protein